MRGARATATTMRGATGCACVRWRPPTSVAGRDARVHGRRALHRLPRKATGGLNGSPTRAQRRAPRAAKTSTCCNGGITAGTAGASSAASAAKRSTGSCSSSMATTSLCACACRATKSARSRRSSWPPFLPMATSLVSMHAHTRPTYTSERAQTNSRKPVRRPKSPFGLRA